MLVRAESASHDDDVMVIAPVPLKPQDLAELSQYVQQDEGVARRRRSPEHDNPPAAFADDLDDQTASSKRAVHMLRMGRRRVGMLRMGRDLGQEGPVALKKAVSMLRMGRNYGYYDDNSADNDSTAESEKEESLLGVDRSLDSEENQPKRAVSMLRMGRNVEAADKRAVGMLRMGRSEMDRRAVSMLRMGRIGSKGDKRAVSMLRMGRSGPDYEKKTVGMLRMGRGDEKRAVGMLRMGRDDGVDSKRAVSMLRMGRSGDGEGRVEQRAVSMLRMG